MRPKGLPRPLNPNGSHPRAVNSGLIVASGAARSRHTSCCKSDQRPQGFGRGSRRSLEAVLGGPLSGPKHAIIRWLTGKICLVTRLHTFCQGFDELLQRLVPDVGGAPFRYHISGQIAPKLHICWSFSNPASKSKQAAQILNCDNFFVQEKGGKERECLFPELTVDSRP